MLVLWAELGSSARASSAGLASLFLFNSISHLPLLRDLSQSPGPCLLWQVNFPPLFVTFQQLWIICVGGLQVDLDLWRPETTSGSVRNLIIYLL